MKSYVHIRRLPPFLFALLPLAIGGMLPTPAAMGAEALEWTELSPLPDPIGFAGAFAGVSSDVLIVAGGANFPDAPPWEDGVKVWHDRIFVLDSPEGTWTEPAEKLPRPLAYGVSITVGGGLVCIGGGDSLEHTAGVFLMSWDSGRMRFADLPDLPGPMAFGSGALLGGAIYVAGGIEKPDSTETLGTFWRLQIDETGWADAWEELEPWPGRPRMLATAGAQDGSFFLFGGTDLVSTGPETARREYLADAYRYSPGQGWRPIAELPRPIVAAPGPAIALGQSHLLIAGGDDGSDAGRDLRDRHPGFRSEILAYHTITDTWTTAGDLPKDAAQNLFPPVTATAVRWNEVIVIPSGEVKPGIRTPKVLMGRPVARESGFAPIDFVAIGLYMGALVAMGIYFAKRERTTEDFFLAGRRIPWWAAGVSIFGTQLSAITFMAVPAKTFATDWTYYVGNMTIIMIAPLVVFLYLPFFRRLEIKTAYEYLERRFNLGVRLFGAAAFVMLQLGRMGIVLFLPAVALSAVTGIDVYLCILVMGVLSTLYTVMGGIEAVIWTDVLQVVLLIGAAIIALVTIAFSSGGFGEVVAVGREAGKFHMFDFSWDYTIPAVWVVLIGSIISNLIPYTADQTVVQRYLATRDERAAARSIWTNAALTLPASIIFFALGTALFVFYKARPELLSPALQTDAIFPWFIAQQLPPGVSGLVVAGIFAAAMSSLDSSMNSVASVLTFDFVRRLGRPRAEDVYLRVARGITLALGIVGTGTALLMATWNVGSLWDLFLMILGLFGGGLAGMFTLGVLTRRANGPGVLVGGVFSALIVFAVQRFTDVHLLLYGAVGFASCVAVGYGASLLLGPGRTDLQGLTIHTLDRNQG